MIFFDLFEKKSLNIVFIGDSITEGGGLDAPPAKASGFLLHEPLIERLNFSNQGHSGFTTLNFLPSTGFAFKDAEKAADSLQKLNEGLLVFSIMLGTNDSAEEGPVGSPVDPESYRKNIMDIADRLLKDYPKCKIVLHLPTWYSPNTYNSSRYMAGGLKRLQSYFSQLAAIVKLYDKTNPQHVFLGDKDAFDVLRKKHLEYYIPEEGQKGVFYLHPNKNGAAMLGKLWAKSIYKIVTSS